MFGLTGWMKWGAILGIVTILSGGVWHYTSLVSDRATLKQEKETFRLAYENEKAENRRLTEIYRLSEMAISELQKEKDRIRTELENVTVDLPEDASDDAPESLKETIRRLRGGQ